MCRSVDPNACVETVPILLAEKVPIHYRSDVCCVMCQSGGGGIKAATERRSLTLRSLDRDVRLGKSHCDQVIAASDQDFVKSP